MKTESRLIAVPEVAHARVHFLDVAKGIGILLVILHHCIARTGTSNVVMNRIALCILSFHMPLFFFVSGWLYRRQETEAYLAGKVRGLLIPVMVYQLVNAGILVVLAMLERNNPLGILFSGFWFTFSVLYASCAFHFVDRFLQKTVKPHKYQRVCHAVIAAGMLTLAVGYSRLVQGTEDTVATAMVGYVFFAAGALCKSVLTSWVDLNKASTKNRCIYAITGMLLAGILVYTANCNQPILMYTSTYGSWKFFLLNALIGISAVFLLSMAVARCPWLEFYGRNSLTIMITHFPVYSFMLLVLQKTACSSVWIIVGAFLATAAIEAFIAKFVDKYLPLLAGKRIIT